MEGLKKTCDTCSFNFANGEGAICANHGYMRDGSDMYGRSVEDMKKEYPRVCPCWKESFEFFVKRN